MSHGKISLHLHSLPLSETRRTTLAYHFFFNEYKYRYVPNPSPAVFRVTKNNHNILQGVAAPSLRLTQENKDIFDQWIYKNGSRWISEGGPLAPGGVDVVFIGQSVFTPHIMT